ncbi:MAG: Ig-like domain-containing protein [Pelagibacterales bacterium]|nr:Ig-like domain-containing protein [Pelagibacterales bacterium]MBL6876762.1 Ig-like domain-containing protein [Flavobacteriales bacterium]
MKKLIYTVLSIVVISGCAKRGSPTGGPVDSIPPVLINASPKINSTNFDSKEIRLTFDEFVKLDKVEEQLIISPPIDKSSYKVKPLSGVTKKVFLEFIDSLETETTYSINFGNSIKDNNEGNPLTFFSYTFSTGETIDSLYVRGNISDAFDIDTDNYISIHLYRIDSVFNDSIIFNNRPTYISNSLDSTSYQFKNIKEGKYLIVAIKDIDNNYFFDPFYDKIGFIDSLITLPQDSIINFKLFKEETSLIWDKPHFINSEKIGFGYYGKLDLKNIKIESSIPDSVQYTYTKERESDTLIFWLSKNSFDSLNFNLIEKDTTKLVTVKFDRAKDTLIDSLSINPKTSNVIHLKETFKLSSNIPLKKIEDSLITIRDIDSLIIPFTTSINDNLDQIEIEFEVSPSDNYKVFILPEAIKDIRGVSNDTLQYNVVSQTLEDYGNVYLDVIRNSEFKFILHMIDSNGDIVREFKNVNLDTTYNFDYVRPGKYTFRLIEDVNNNDKWDTGNYLKKVKPESVYYFSKELEVRANWDLNETFNLNQILFVKDSIN